MLSILFVGPITPPIHGLSVAFEEIYTKSKTKKYLVNQNFENMALGRKIGATVFALLKITYYLIFNKIDVVYFTCSPSKFGSLKDIYLLYISNLFGKRIINHLHAATTQEFYDSLCLLHKKLLLNAYKKIDTSIVLLPSMKEQLSVLWPSMKIEVISNFYSDDLNTIKVKEEHETIELLYLSNIIKSKGIFDLLTALEILDNKDVNYKLSIAGAFMSDENLSKEEVKKKFQDKIKNNINVKYLGSVYGFEKTKLLERSDIFILPTFYKMEAFPISILEAMRAGNIIIATHHNYLPDVINEKNGILIDIKSPSLIANAIETYVNNKELRKKIQNYNMRYAEKNFSSAAYVENLDDLFIKDS